jgi:hypothetical protein
VKSRDQVALLAFFTAIAYTIKSVLDLVVGVVSKIVK